MNDITPEKSAALPRVRDALRRLEQIASATDVPFGRQRTEIAELMQAISLDVAVIGNLHGEPDFVMALNLLIAETRKAPGFGGLDLTTDLFVGQVRELLDHYEP